MKKGKIYLLQRYKRKIATPSLVRSLNKALEICVSTVRSEMSN